MAKHLLLILLMAGIGRSTFAQQPQFSLQVDEKIHHYGPAYGLTQDQQGYIWFSSFAKGLIRYDGKEFKVFRHEPEKPNSPASNFIVSLAVDSSGNIWIVMYGNGLDRFNPVTNTFTHFRNKKGDANSLISDSVVFITIDHNGNPWVGSDKGLEMFDSKNNKFIHIQKKINDKPADISPGVFVVYEDKEGIIWFSSSEFFTGKATDFGGLFRLDPKTGKQIFYKADPLNPESLINPNVSAIFEDSQGNFWVGTKGNGLHTLDRKTGKFVRYLYDPAQPGKLSRPSISKNDSTDGIWFIREDHARKIWIGSLDNGINWYDPQTKQLYHYGAVEKKSNAPFEKDTTTGFKDYAPIRFMIAKDSSTWVTSNTGNIYIASYGRKTIPYFPNKNAVNSFYLESNGNILWFGTDSGLVRKDLHSNSIKIWTHDPKNPNSLNDNSVVSLQPVENGKLYVGAHVGGLDLFDPATEKFTHIKPANATPGNTLDSLHFVFIENDRYLWLGGEHGLARVDRATNNFKVYRFNIEDTKGISGSTVFSIAKDKKNNVWFANVGGLDRFISDSNSFRHYLKGYSIRAIFADSQGTLWAGTDIGLFEYNEAKDQFVEFNSTLFSMGIETILSILEDDQHCLWVTTSNGILKISANREHIQKFNADYGILSSNWNWLNNYKAADGRLFIGGTEGYYMFKPQDINVITPAPLLNFSQLIVGGKEVFPEEDGILTNPIWKTEKISLSYNQNSFSVDFVAVNYNSSEAIKYLYQLENFDNTWNNIGTDHKVSFFNVPPGRYILHVRAINSEGTITEKTLAVVISPPWWKTWWAYCLYALLGIGILGGYIQYRSKVLRRENLVLEQKVEHRTKQLQESIESLKATQAQLIQSEKMASLGELTAGIAHEIQNPLNFVNNFSEVSNELIDEMNTELDNGNITEAKLIAEDVKQNLQKINHHGKRADGIVKGMLQHSSSGSGRKESSDINKLADEYLRLAYHGLRAKDKSFNVTLKTDYDDKIGNINIIPQDIGRVILNLITNAFYAVDERKKLALESLPTGQAGPPTGQAGLPTGQAGPPTGQAGYEPTVSVITKKVDKRIEITVADNGNGIPPNVLDKIFQPFFTTKPTGLGTGLGLSLAYDIVKGHGGKLEVQTKEGDGTRFTIVLPE